MQARATIPFRRNIPWENLVLNTLKETRMRNFLPGLMICGLSAGLVPALMAPAIAADAATAPAARYSVASTLVGKLLDDPAANAVLKKMIPTVYSNEMFQSAGRELTLKDIQQYEPVALSEENMAKIQAELDKLPVKG
jgi:para-nitrobenzyl esterase